MTSTPSSRRRQSGEGVPVPHSNVVHPQLGAQYSQRSPPWYGKPADGSRRSGGATVGGGQEWSGRGSQWTGLRDSKYTFSL